MKPIKLSFVIAALLVLSACSKGPSTSEAKAVLESQIKNCSPLSITKFEKDNGVEINDRTYDVMVSYTINYEAPAANKKLDAELIPAHDERVKSEHLRLEKIRVDTAGKKNYRYVGSLGIPLDHPQETASDYEIAVDDYNRESERLNKVTLKAADDNIFKACQNVAALYVVVGVFPDIQSYDGNNQLQNIYVKDMSHEFTATYRMVKTDNGWMVR